MQTVRRLNVRAWLSDKRMADSPQAQRYLGTAAGAIYDDVSLEHVLRRLLETTAGAAFVNEAEETLKARLGVIARKYEEYCSALGADFKRNALRRSLWVGIVLAFVMNADGVRLLATYLEDGDRRERVIAQLAEPAAAAPAVAQGDSADEALAAIADARSQLGLIADLALPIGASYFPYCHVSWLHGEGAPSPDPLCQGDLGAAPAAAWPLWFLKVLVTGILMGLGAPVWYDVANRLAEVRSAFGGKGSAEEAHRGADAGDLKDGRAELINRIVADVKAAAKVGLPAARV